MDFTSRVLIMFLLRCSEKLTLFKKFYLFAASLCSFIRWPSAMSKWSIVSIVEILFVSQKIAM